MNEAEPEQAPPELEWEDWDGKSPFIHHCIAGSIAGVAEHTLTYPFDTVKTHMQAYCATCPKNPANQLKGEALSSTNSGRWSANPAEGNMWSTMRSLIQNGHIRGNTTNTAAVLESSNTSYKTATLRRPVTTLSPNFATSSLSPEVGFLRLWRGVQSMAMGSAPAHALYFSSYEMIKSASLLHSKDPTLGPIAASIAGATATILHDSIMCPMDTIKQRMQLGHYTSVYDAFVTIVKTSGEGWIGLYRSFGVTLGTNVPYGMIMMTTNEWLRKILLQDKAQVLDLSTTMIAGCGAGTVAAALTCPLDRVKTRLQTQTMGMILPEAAAVECGATGCGAKSFHKPQYTGFKDALASIIKEEGYTGLWRGVGPRIFSQAPAVAISWSAYEFAKKWLLAENYIR